MKVVGVQHNLGDDLPDGELFSFLEVSLVGQLDRSEQVTHGSYKTLTQVVFKNRNSLLKNQAAPACPNVQLACVNVNCGLCIVDCNLWNER